MGYAEADPTLDIYRFGAADNIILLTKELLGFTKVIKAVKILFLIKK